MIVNEFIPKPYTQLLDRGAVAYSAPSNIALVKYWGKKAHQIPANPSISFTLNNCKTALNHVPFFVHLQGHELLF